jgi:hypothetical protein
MVVPPSADQTELVATELSQVVASLTSTPLPEFHELTSPGSLAHPPSQLQVYTRRPRRIVVAQETDSRQDDDTVGVADPRETPLAEEVGQSTREAFISNLAQHTASIMATPTAFKHSTKTVQAGQKQRRSRRIAGNQATRTLNVISDHEGVSQQAQDAYSKVFGQPLSGLHLEALASLFNGSISNFR